MQYTQLLSWACLIVHIYYSASFILVYSTIPMLSDLTFFSWSALIEQNFIISPLFSMALSFFWFSLLDQCSMIYYYKIGLLYRTSIIHLYQLHIGLLYRPIFLYITYILGLIYKTNLIFGFLY